MSILLPRCFCCSRVLYLCFHIWKHTSLYLWIWKCSKLFLLYSEFLGCFTREIPLSSIVLEELYLEGMNAQALPGFQPLLRKSVMDEL